MKWHLQKPKNNLILTLLLIVQRCCVVTVCYLTHQGRLGLNSAATWHKVLFLYRERQWNRWVSLSPIALPAVAEKLLFCVWLRELLCLSLISAALTPSQITNPCCVAQFIHQTVHSSVGLYDFPFHPLPHNLRLTGAYSPRPRLSPPPSCSPTMINTMKREREIS